MICRICGGELISRLNLGSICPSDFIDISEESKVFPLDMCECRKCGLIQLGESVDLDLMYRQYWYRSGLNPSMVQDLKDLVYSIEQRIDLSDGGVVVDIGANDGTLLDAYKSKAIFKVAYEPALNLKSFLEPRCDIYIPEYFDASKYTSRKAKVITSIAMFYDLPDPAKFVEDVSKILDEDGLWVIQFTDLLSMLKVNAFDNLCHEHLEYYRLTDVVNLLSKFGLEVFDATYNQTNGSSIRIYAGFKGKNNVSIRLAEMVAEENLFFSNGDMIDKFVRSVEEEKFKLMLFLEKEKQLGKSISAIGASTKGNTLLQYYGIDSSILTFIGEVNKDKFGLKTPGSNIPIIPEEQVLQLKPDYLLVLPWHFKNFFIKSFIKYMDEGGTLIFPLPIMCTVKRMNNKYVCEYNGGVDE